MGLSFDGIDDKISFGDLAALDAPSAFSVAFWAQPKAGVAVNDSFFSKKPSNTTGFDIQAGEADATRLSFQIQPGATRGDIAGAMTADVWQHQMWVYNGGGAANADRLKLWLNGVAQTLSFTGTIPASITDSGTAAVMVANSAINPVLFMPVWMAHLMVWTVALSDDHAASQCRSRRPIWFSNLLIWTPLDDGTLAQDYSGSENHGTVTGALSEESPIGAGFPVHTF